MSCDAVFPADPRKSTWLDIRMTCLTSHIVFVFLHVCLRVCGELVGVKKQRVGVHIFTVYYANTAHSLSVLTFSLQQVQTCVWDVSSPFKIVLVKGSKVNAEETAKVNT